MLGTRESFIVRLVGIFFTRYEFSILPAIHTAVLKSIPFLSTTSFVSRAQS